MVTVLYGTDLLRQMQATYQARYQKALERGYQAEGNKYFWLYGELRYRLTILREAMLYLDALPKFLDTPDQERPYQYIVEYVTRYFSPEVIGSTDGPDGKSLYFNDGNPYWLDVQESMDAFNDPSLLRNLPLFYVFSCELVTRAIRLYFQIREDRFHAIDREKFDALMQNPAALSSPA